MENTRLGIGQVRRILTQEFPDLTISKIRFLEKEGLITVERTPSGYRKFSPDDIQKLRFILRLQKDQYLPLEVIKKKIKDFEHGKVTASDLVAGLGQTGQEEDLAESMSITVDTAPNKLGMTPKTIQEFIDYGLVKVHSGEQGDYFRPEDVAVLKLAKHFARYGIESRHLKMYVQFAKRQAAYFQQIVRPQLQHRDSTVRRSAYRDLEELVELSRMISDALLQSRLKEYLPGRRSTVEVPVEEKPEVEAADKEEEGTLSVMADTEQAGISSQSSEGQGHPTAELFPK